MRWILVATAAHARLLQQPQPDAPLTLLEEFDHARSRLPSARLGRDRAGWAEGPGHTGGAALTPAVDPHRHEQQRFAHELAVMLEHAAAQDRYQHLDLLAPPALLGDLRQAAGPATQRRLHEERALDLGHVGWPELVHRLAEELGPAAAHAGLPHA